MKDKVIKPNGYVRKQRPSTCRKINSSDVFGRIAFLFIGAAAGAGITYYIIKKKEDEISTQNKVKSNFPKTGVPVRTNDIIKFDIESEGVSVKSVLPDNHNEKGQDGSEKKVKKEPLNENRKKSKLSYPPLFSNLSEGQRKEVIDGLYKELCGSHIHCSSLNYFKYVFGGLGLPNNYKPSECDYIDWTTGKPSLQCLIIQLYRPKGEERVVRGTWLKAENCFLLDGELISLGTLKLNTNHIIEAREKEIKQIISKVSKAVKKGIARQ